METPARDTLVLATQIGPIELTAHANRPELGAVALGARRAGRAPGGGHAAILDEAAEAIAAYLLGDLRATARIGLGALGDLHETDARILAAVASLPPGVPVDAAAFAAHVGVSASEVRRAVRRNPLPLVVPDHRLLGPGGSALGWLHGPAGVRRWLLRHEGTPHLP